MATVRSRWKLYDSLEIIPVDDELFIFDFITEEDMTRILNSEPWSIYGQLLLLAQFLPRKPLQEAPLQLFHAWFTFKNLPPLTGWRVK